MDFTGLQGQDIALIKAALSGITVGLTQVIKTARIIPEPDRWMPAIAVGIGFFLGMFYSIGVIESFLVGLGAIGGYEVAKTTVAGRTD